VGKHLTAINYSYGGGVGDSTPPVFGSLVNEFGDFVVEVCVVFQIENHHRPVKKN